MHIMVYTEKSQIPKQRGPFYINFPFYISFYLPISRNWKLRFSINIPGTLTKIIPWKKKNVKNTHGEILLLVKLQVEACNFTKSNILPVVFFTFLKLYRLHQTAQSITYNQTTVTFETVKSIYCSQSSWKMFLRFEPSWIDFFLSISNNYLMDVAKFLF